MDVKVLSNDDLLERFSAAKKPSYYAMYSSWFGGIVTNSNNMLIPIDDHIVHRGDGVFEAFKFQYGAFYDLDAHLDRLERSAKLLHLQLPIERSDVVGICQQLIRVADVKAATLRLYLSRGPGSFAANPYDSYGQQLYIVATSLKHPADEKYTQGCSLNLSEVEAKETPYSQIKSCNYMQNVLMKKEAVDAGVDFTVSATKEGLICEGSTENIAIINENNELIAPPLDLTLQGTTMMVVMELAQKLVSEKKLNNVRFDNLFLKDLKKAKEILVMGTTIEVLPVVKFNGQPVNTGQPGPVAITLLELLRSDMKENHSRRTTLE